MFQTPPNRRLVRKVLFFVSPFSICCITLFSFLLLVLSKPSSQFPQYHLENRSIETDSDGQCGFGGDNDTYGLGIRLGLYIQWLTFIITCGFVTQEARSIRGITNCFQGAMFVALIYITVSKGSELYAVEAYIVLSFCFGGAGLEAMISSGIADIDEHEYSNFGDFAIAYMMHLGGFIQFSLGMGLYAYGVWFFFTGMDNMKHPSCSTFIFFFSKLHVYHWIRTFMKVFFMINLVVQASLLFAFIFVKIVMTVEDIGDARRAKKREESVGATGDQPSKTQAEISTNPAPLCATCGTTQQSAGDRPTDRSREKDTGLGCCGVLIVLILGCFRAIFIASIEKMIQWNNIQGVNGIGSTGQLLPLLIAIGGLCSTLYTWYKPKK